MTVATALVVVFMFIVKMVNATCRTCFKNVNNTVNNVNLQFVSLILVGELPCLLDLPAST